MDMRKGRRRQVQGGSVVSRENTAVGSSSANPRTGHSPAKLTGPSVRGNKRHVESPLCTHTKPDKQMK